MTIFASPYPKKDIPTTVSITEHILGDRSDAERVAFTDPALGKTVTYGQLFQSIDNISRNLQSLKFEKGTRVAILLPNMIEYCPILLGSAAAGLTVSTINPLYTATEIQKQLQDCGAKLLFTLPPFFEKALEATVSSPSTVESFVLVGVSDEAQTSPLKDQITSKGSSLKLRLYSEFADSEGPKEFPAQVKIDPVSDVVILPYSSGTTGLPKGVMLTHHNLVANCLQLEGVEDVSKEDVLLGVLPFFHIFGLVVTMFLGVKTRGHTVLMARFDLEKFLNSVQEHKVTRIYIVPPIALALAKHPLVDKYDLKSLKVLFSGAAPLSGSLTTAVTKRLGVTVKQGYGMTELSPAAAVDCEDPAMIHQGAVGRLLCNTEAKLVDTSDPSKNKGVDEEGELCIRGPQVMKGYLNKGDATAATIDSDGWLHTGDVATIDKDGYLRIVDRVKELIKYKGFQVPPAELEAILLTHEAIADAAVIGVPDEAAGELPVAFVVKKAGQELSSDDLMNFVNKDIASYKKIHRVEWVEQIPKSASGKILRRILRAQIAEKA